MHIQDNVIAFIGGKNSFFDESVFNCCGGRFALNYFDSVGQFFFQVDYKNVQLIVWQLDSSKNDYLDEWNMVKLHCSDVKIIVRTGNIDLKTLVSILSLGISGYLALNSEKEETRTAIHLALSNQCYINPSIALHILRYFQPVEKNSFAFNISYREEQVIRGLKDGLSYKEISMSMHVSIDTIRSHVRKIYNKFSVNNKAQLIRKVST